jgi:hypothetical protein
LAVGLPTNNDKRPPTHNIAKKLKNHDSTGNPAPPSQPTNDQIQKNNGRTAPPQTHLKRPQKIQKNDQTQKIRLTDSTLANHSFPYKHMTFETPILQCYFYSSIN